MIVVGTSGYFRVCVLWGGFSSGGRSSGLLLLGIGRVVEGSVGAVRPSGGVFYFFPEAGVVPTYETTQCHSPQDYSMNQL
jgi:hypothetical protein